jgi:hypothetical protein
MSALNPEHDWYIFGVEGVLGRAEGYVDGTGTPKKRFVFKAGTLGALRYLHDHDQKIAFFSPETTPAQLEMLLGHIFTPPAVRDIVDRSRLSQSATKIELKKDDRYQQLMQMCQDVQDDTSLARHLTVVEVLDRYPSHTRPFDRQDTTSEHRARKWVPVPPDRSGLTSHGQLISAVNTWQSILDRSMQDQLIDPPVYADGTDLFICPTDEQGIKAVNQYLLRYPGHMAIQATPAGFLSFQYSVNHQDPAYAGQIYEELFAWVHKMGWCPVSLLDLAVQDNMLKQHYFTPITQEMLNKDSELRRAIAAHVNSAEADSWLSELEWGDPVALAALGDEIEGVAERDSSVASSTLEDWDFEGDSNFSVDEKDGEGSSETAERVSLEAKKMAAIQSLIDRITWRDHVGFLSRAAYKLKSLKGDIRIEPAEVARIRAVLDQPISDQLTVAAKYSALVQTVAEIQDSPWRRLVRFVMMLTSRTAVQKVLDLIHNSENLSQEQIEQTAQSIQPKRASVESIQHPHQAFLAPLTSITQAEFARSKTIQRARDLTAASPGKLAAKTTFSRPTSIPCAVEQLKRRLEAGGVSVLDHNRIASQARGSVAPSEPSLEEPSQRCSVAASSGPLRSSRVTPTFHLAYADETDDNDDAASSLCF